ncbi:hypothetical protein BC830DRAFT_332102 [Chytriomyces sp. MP71]|nr:hypothetical protein BC830DRAFT_332102 [Chytriomyces sp. MP71]
MVFLFSYGFELIGLHRLCNGHITELFTLPQQVTALTTTTTTTSTVTTTTSTSSTTITTSLSVTSPQTGTTKTSTTTTFSPASTLTIPNNVTLIQSNSYVFGNEPACWEVAPNQTVIASICDQSNVNQWWSFSLGQLVFYDSSGNAGCAGYFIFNPTSNFIRLASTYKCASIVVQNGTIVQYTCAASSTLAQVFKASNSNLLFPPASTSSCASYTYRSEWRDFTAQDRSKFIAAMNGVRQLPSTAGRRSYFDDLVGVHAALLDYVHGSHIFWPWHRNYVKLFEDALQLVDPTVTLPYWDWGLDGHAPLKNIDIFGPGVLQFGTRGDPSRSYPTCLSDGYAQNWTSLSGQCTSRNYTLTTVVYDDSYMLPLVLKSADFGTFGTSAEAAHNVIHFYIGGIQGDLYFIDLSTNDPLFFVHHANVDRYWHLWQYHHQSLAGSYTGTTTLPPGSGNRVQLRLTDILPGFNIPASTAMFSDGSGFCIKYIPYSQSAMSVAISDVAPSASLSVTTTSTTSITSSFTTSTTLTASTTAPVTQTNPTTTQGTMSEAVTSNAPMEMFARIHRDLPAGMLMEVPSVPDSWTMFSILRPEAGFQFTVESLARMNQRMWDRLRQGEAELNDVGREFAKKVAEVYDGMGSLESARVDALNSIIAELHSV